MEGRTRKTENKKTSWPEVIGKTGEEAQQIIVGETRDSMTRIGIIQLGSMMIRDYRQDPVRIIVDETGIVTKATQIG